MKKCSKCSTLKDLSCFYANKKTMSFRAGCKECLNRLHRDYISNRKEIGRPVVKKDLSHEERVVQLSEKKRYYELHKERYLKKNKEKYLLNKDIILAKQKTYRKNSKNSHWFYIKNRIESGDINFKLRIGLRSRLCVAIKNNQKAGSAVSDLGCSIGELKQHLESKFQSGMSWDNWSRVGWHIDHIVPLSLFDLSDPEQFKQACHYTNLQPLWAKDNLIKGAR